MFNNNFSVCLCVFWVLSVTCHLYEGDVCVTKGTGRRGQCVNIRRCHSALNDIKMKGYPQLCSFNGTHPIICCTDAELIDDTSVMLDNKTLPGRKARDNCIKYLTGTPYSCTIIRNRTEIFVSPPTKPASPGAMDAVANEYPHMALLGYGKDWNTAEWLCAGSIISDRFILTTAHCTEARSLGSVRYVILGILKRSEIPRTRKEQRYKVKSIFIHPEYDFPIKYHDIALLEVNSSIQFNSNSIKPACLALDSTANIAAALSWGSLGRDQELADTLQVMHFNKFSNEECRDAYPIYRNFPNGFDPQTQACFGDKNNVSYTCSSDSGGPFQVKLHIAKGPYSKPCGEEIIGLASFGSPCPRGPFSTAGIFTNVPYYVPWIENIVWP